jgi:Spy/CpxP family protein refolding chaperone
MVRLSGFVGMLVLILLVGGGLSGQDKSGSDKKDTPGKARGTLPQYWKQLGLSEEQRQKIYATQNKYQVQIDQLSQQIQELRKHRQSELEKILTDEQKARLRKILADRGPKESTPPKDVKPEPKDKKATDKGTPKDK